MYTGLRFPVVFALVSALYGAIWLAGCRLDDGLPAEDAGRDALSELDVRDEVDGDEVSEVRQCAVVATTDFGATGRIALIDAASFEVTTDVTGTWHDVALSETPAGTMVVNRQGADSVQLLDESGGFRTRWEESVGGGSNPLSVLFVDDDRAIVTRYAEGDFLPLHFDDGFSSAPRLGEAVALDASHEADARAEIGRAFMYDGVLYVVQEGFGDYPNCGEGKARLTAWDPTTFEPAPVFGEGESYLELSWCNAGSVVFVDEGVVDIAMVGVYSYFLDPDDGVVSDGGIERVDLNAGVSLGRVVSEANAGNRDISRLIAGEDGRYWAMLADREYETALVRYFPAYNEEREPGFGSDIRSGGMFFGVEARWGYLWIADRRFGSEGVIVLDSETLQEVEGSPFDTGLPPYGFAFTEVEGTSCAGR